MGVYKKQPKKISRLIISDIEKLMFYYRQKYITVFYGFIRCNKVDQNIYSDILLSGKTQKDKIILLEALYNRTSGVHFQKASPPNQKGLAPVVLFVVLWQGCSPMFCRDFP